MQLTNLEKLNNDRSFSDIDNEVCLMLGPSTVPLKPGIVEGVVTM